MAITLAVGGVNFMQGIYPQITAMTLIASPNHGAAADGPNPLATYRLISIPRMRRNKTTPSTMIIAGTIADFVLSSIAIGLPLSRESSYDLVSCVW
jgi:hypothetical protein